MNTDFIHAAISREAFGVRGIPALSCLQKDFGRPQTKAVPMRIGTLQTLRAVRQRLAVAEVDVGSVPHFHMLHGLEEGQKMILKYAELTTQRHAIPPQLDLSGGVSSSVCTL
jgi:hypothetical protein